MQKLFWAYKYLSAFYLFLFYDSNTFSQFYKKKYLLKLNKLDLISF